MDRLRPPAYLALLPARKLDSQNKLGQRAIQAADVNEVRRRGRHRLTLVTTFLCDGKIDDKSACQLLNDRILPRLDNVCFVSIGTEHQTELSDDWKWK